MALSRWRKTLRGVSLDAAGALCWSASLGLGPLACDAQVDPSYTGEPLITIQGQVEAPLGVGAIEVGLLWFLPARKPLADAVDCRIVLSGEAASACVIACGLPSCDNLARLDAWEDCALGCDGPSGVSSIEVETRAERFFSGALGQATPVRGEFPARFRLDLLEPPPDEVLSRSSTGERIGISLFVALDPSGAPFELDLAERPRFPAWLVGGSGSHVLIFSPDGVPSGSEWSTLLEVELDPGFQLLEVSAVDAAPDGGEEEGLAYQPVRSLEAAQVQLTVADPASIDWPISP
jgi:hypothetical protein